MRNVRKKEIRGFEERECEKGLNEGCGVGGGWSSVPTVL